MRRIPRLGTFTRLGRAIGGVIDTTAPSLAITAPGVDPVVSAAFDIVITASEPVYGLALGDIDVTNGTASAFTGSDGDTVFGATITPTANGTVAVDIAAGVCTDQPAGAGNPNTASNLLSRTAVVYYLLDTFTGADATALESHTPDIDTVGGGWQLAGYRTTDTPGGDGEILSNQLSLGTTNQGYVIDIGAADFDLSVDWYVAVGVDNRNLIVFRYNANGDMLYFQMREPQADWTLGQIVGDTITSLHTSAYTWTEGATYTIRITASGNTITVYIQDALIVSDTITQFNTETKVGLMLSGGNAASRCDNLEVRPFDAAPQLWGVAYNLVGDETFDKTTLNATAETWYDRLVAMDVTGLASYAKIAAFTDDAAAITGIDAIEPISNDMMALASAFLATGSLAILDMLDEFMVALETPLITNSFWLSLSHMAHANLVGLLFKMVRLYEINAGKTSPGSVDYAAQASTWGTYLDSTYLPARGINGEALRHRNIQGVSAKWHRYVRSHTYTDWFDAAGISGTWDGGYKGYRAFYLAEYRSDFYTVQPESNGYQLIDGRRRWDHYTPYPWLATNYGWQSTNYASYTMAQSVELALQGLRQWNYTEMVALAATAAYLMADFASTGYIREDMVNTTINETWGIGRLTNWWAIYALGRWNSSLTTYGDDAWAEVGTGTNVAVPAGMLVATI